MVWHLPRSIGVPNLKFLASPVRNIRHRCHAMAGYTRDVLKPQTNARISIVLSFFSHPTSLSGVIIVEWSLLHANVVDFRYVFAL